LTVFVQYRTQVKGEEWAWLPANPKKSADAVIHQLPLGKEIYAEVEKNRILCSRARLWAKATSKGTEWLEYKDQDLWLVPEVDRENPREHVDFALETQSAWYYRGCTFRRGVAMNEVTCILSAIEQGDPQAAEELLPLIYEELRKLAAQKLAQEKPGQTLQATALVHEAYLRLVDAAKPQEWDGRRHFFASAAEAMRRILVENARKKGRQKRGGQLVRQDLDSSRPAAPEESDELLALDEALTLLAAKDEVAAKLVQLRFFAGMTIPQAAEVLGISARSADRPWAYARAWLHAEISGK
jgi:RNA polymerase sigma factor (TIGR02999 family)